MLCIFYVEPERVLNKQDQKLHEIRESRQSKIALESFLMHGHDIVCPSVCLPVPLSPSCCLSHCLLLQLRAKLFAVARWCLCLVLPVLPACICKIQVRCFGSSVFLRLFGLKNFAVWGSTWLTMLRDLHAASDSWLVSIKFV